MEKRVICEYDYEELTKALTVIPTKGSKTSWISAFIFLLIGISFLLLGYSEDSKMLKVCAYIILGCALFMFLLVLICLPKVKLLLFYNATKKNNKQFEKGVRYEYIFLDEEFEVLTISGMNNGSSTVKYKDLNRCVYDKENVYFFVNNVSAYLCKKELFTEDELNEIITKVKKK